MRKADAPDYYNGAYSQRNYASACPGSLHHAFALALALAPVIKHPMDLGTILKKVKAQAYKDKKAFKADLELIWDNCFIYNTLAVSRLHCQCPNTNAWPC